MQCAKHACDELVDAVTFVNKRDEGGDATFIVANIAEVRENELLELLNLILQYHEIGDGFVAFVRIIDGLQADVFFILKGAVEFRVLLVERQLGQEKVDILADQGAVSTNAFATHSSI